MFINCVIILASVTIGNAGVRDKFSDSTVKRALLIGSLSGILGILLMLYSVHMSDTITFDFRILPIILMGIYFSYSGAFAAAGVISIFRIAVWGWNDISFYSMLVVFAIAALCAAIGRSQKSLRFKWVVSVAGSTAVASLGMLLYWFSSPMLLTILAAFSIGMAAASVGMYYLINHTVKRNEESTVLMDNLHKDFLTGLKNVRYFNNALNQYVKDSIKQKENVSLLFIDIDHFKQVNDMYSHISGDIVLKEIGTILMRLSRNNDIVTRKGGEEFTILLSNCRLEQAWMVAERIRVSVQNMDFISEKKKIIKTTVSIGVSSYPETTREISKLIEQADAALYAAKRLGRNRVYVTEKINQPAPE